MRPARHLLEAIQATGRDFHCLHRYPYVLVIVVDPSFAGVETEERLRCMAQSIKWTPEEVEETAQRANLEILLLTETEYQSDFPRASERGQSWLREVLSGLVKEALPETSANKALLPTLHFYGYKGGQARSSCLGYLARVLANDRWRVLVIDADLEAPSLDVLFGQQALRPENTLLGLNAGIQIQPRRAYEPDVGSGCVDLIACRPDGNEYQLESVALSMGLAMDPGQIGRLCKRLVLFAKEDYDVILVDHRAGLSPFVIPWMEALPGQIVIFARLDDQWRAARDYLPALLHRASEPAVFVAFRGDGESPSSFVERTTSQVHDLLSELATVVNQKMNPPGDRSASDLRPQFLIWPFDPAFRYHRLPDTTQTTGELREVVYELRRLTSVDGQRKLHGLSKSGAQDHGDFVQTAPWRELLRPETQLRYIFGRKGTGKTRLLRQMQQERLGQALLVDRLDESSFGLRAGSEILNRAIERFALAPEAFFWMLFGCAMELPDTARAGLESRIVDALEQGTDLSLNVQRLRQNLVGKPRRVFLIDGLESAFPNDKLSRFIEYLFRVLWAIQSDRTLHGTLDFRVFVRTDLANFGLQNREQQMEGQVAHLRWNYQSILNFALLRLLAEKPGPPVFAEFWPQVVASISAQRETLSRGALAISDAEGLLLEIFPKRFSQDNTLTTNFLRTHFTDSDTPILSASSLGSQPDSTYYPRVFDVFLEEIAKSIETDGAGSMDDGRIRSELLYQAHEAAAQLFLDQIRQELDFRIMLSPDSEKNRRYLNRMLTAFQGEETPFRPGALAKRIWEKLGEDVVLQKVREALDQMREIGMFEGSPLHPEEWQTGRLFKASLKMKTG